mgnify:FL=1|jgi:hypothetical protein
MELDKGITRIKHLVKRLRDAEVFAEEPETLENIIELFQVVEDLDTPQQIGAEEMWGSAVTEDGKKIKA